MTELKNCPFCGQKPRIWERKRGVCNFTVGCDTPTCFVWIPDDVRLSELPNYATCYRTKEMAIDAWNTRSEK